MRGDPPAGSCKTGETGRSERPGGTSSSPNINCPRTKQDDPRGQTRKASRAFEAAIAEDNAWFAANPDKTSRRRKVRPAELPRALRHRGIREVVIERAGPGEFVRRFLDIDGRAVASGLDYYQKPVVPTAPYRGTSTRIDEERRTVERIDVAPEIIATDRQYFEDHPDAVSYTRAASAEELEYFDVHERMHIRVPTADGSGRELPLPEGTRIIEGEIAVRQVAPGVRHRRLANFTATIAGVPIVFFIPSPDRE